jgi:hypothetical protein
MTSSTAFVWHWMLAGFILVFVLSGIDAANEWYDNQRKSDENSHSYVGMEIRSSLWK